MFVAEDGGRMILLTQQVKKWTLSIFSAGYKQIIDKPTHIANNSMSCIDLLL